MLSCINQIWLKQRVLLKSGLQHSGTHIMTNADPIELEKFSQLAHKWWDPNSEFKPLHDINPLRLGYIDRHAGLAGKTVLDVGWGGGHFSGKQGGANANSHGE